MYDHCRTDKVRGPNPRTFPTQYKAHYAEGTALDQRLAQQRAEEARKLAGSVGVQSIGADVSLADAREQARAEANRQVVIDKAVYDRAHAAGDTASMKLAHQDAQAQRNAGAVVGSGEDQQQARDHLQQILDTEIVTHKDAWDSTADTTGRDREHRQAEMLRQVGQTVGVGTIGQDVSLVDAQVHLVLEGGPLVAGGRATKLQAGDAAALRTAQEGIDGGQPDVSGMRDLFMSLQARANTGDVSAAAALLVLQRQADRATLNPPPPPQLDVSSNVAAVSPPGDLDPLVPPDDTSDLNDPSLIPQSGGEDPRFNYGMMAVLPDACGATIAIKPTGSGSLNPLISDQWFAAPLGSNGCNAGTRSVVEIPALGLGIPGLTKIRIVLSDGSTDGSGPDGANTPKPDDEGKKRSLLDQFWTWVRHATVKRSWAVDMATNGINPRKLGANNRFGAAFYVADQTMTAEAEVKYHGGVPKYIVRFKVDLSKARILDLTDPATAAEWGYVQAGTFEEHQPIGARAREAGYNVIKYPSLRGPGDNYAVLADFKELLVPQSFYAVKP